MENLQNCIFFQANDLFKVFHYYKTASCCLYLVLENEFSRQHGVCSLFLFVEFSALLMIMITSSTSSSSILNLQSHKMRGKMCCSSSPGHNLQPVKVSLEIAKSTIHMSFAAGANTVFSITIITHVGLGKLVV